MCRVEFVKDQSFYDLTYVKLSVVLFCSDAT